MKNHISSSEPDEIRVKFVHYADNSIFPSNNNSLRSLEELKSGPLMVIQRSRPAGYLVGAEEFETLIEKLEELEDIVEGMQAIQEVLQDPDIAVDAEKVFGKLGI